MFSTFCHWIWLGLWLSLLSLHVGGCSGRYSRFAECRHTDNPPVRQPAKITLSLSSRSPAPAISNYSGCQPLKAISK